MFNKDILYISYGKYIKTKFFISNMHCQELNLDNFKGIFFALSDLQIVVYQPNIVLF